jgi:hydroxymethylglutaryl-CoA reductase
MYQNNTIKGFSKLTKEEKLKLVSSYFPDAEIALDELKEFWHPDQKQQKLFDEFSENTISNFFFPFGVAPNMTINGKNYMVPMVIEESSVIAAASSSAKYWAERGGFKSKIISTEKIGQVHFLWNGATEKLTSHLPNLKKELFNGTKHITSRMDERGGGITDIEIIDLTSELDNYYQLKASFETMNSMGANFINSCLEEFALILKNYLANNSDFSADEKKCDIIMSILSNYTPNCLVETSVECEIKRLKHSDIDMEPDVFAEKFKTAVKIAQIDTHRATTHNKGIFNGIDAVALSTGNDFRAIEACGHTYAARSGKYKSLTEVEIKDGMFKYTLRIPLALGTIGGLTKLHPLAKRSLELLGNPDAEELMMIMATAGLANNFGAIKSLVTKGIQQGHMKMHLFNILNQYHANEVEKSQARDFFENQKVSVKKVSDYLASLRQ